jgi:hypothetical protein
MRRRIGERDWSGARNGEHRELRLADRIGQRRQQLHLARLCSPRHIAVAQACARAVVAHDAKAFRQTSEEMAETSMFPISLHVADPPRRTEDERPVAHRRVGDPGAVCIADESNGLHCRHRPLHPEFSFVFHDNLIVFSNVARHLRV